MKLRSNFSPLLPFDDGPKSTARGNERKKAPSQMVCEEEANIKINIQFMIEKIK